MQKRFLLPIVFVLALMLSISFVLADHGEEHEDLSDISDQQIEDELGDGGSINGFDRFFDRIFQDEEEYSKERAAEIRTLIKEGKYEEARSLIEDYRRSAEAFEKEVSPEQKEEAERRSRIIRKAYSQIIDDVPEEYKDDFEQISERERKIEKAAQIADKINSLCEELIDLGEYKKARQVCNLEGEEDEPAWKKEKREKWLDTISEDGQEFFEVLEQCITGECNCNNMPAKAQVDLCFQINEAPEDEQQELIDEFRDSLPPELQRVMDRAMEEFEERSYEELDRRPEECQDLNFRDCMLLMAEEHLKDAPEQCRDPIRQAIKDGGIRGERDAKRLCEDILFGNPETRPEGCEDVDDPRDCRELFRESRHSGPGFDFRACEGIEDDEKALECFRRAADDRERYYDEKFEFREEHRGEDYKEKFERRFAAENKGAFDYEEYYENEEDSYRRYEQTRKAEIACVQQCSPDRSWSFRDGVCTCGPSHREHHEEFKDFREHEEEFKEFEEEFEQDRIEEQEDFEEEKEEEFEENKEEQEESDESQEEPQQSPPEDNSGSIITGNVISNYILG